MTAIGDVWYRYINDGIFIYREELPVAKLTPCGVWLDDYGLKRFVLNGEGKRYAYPTDEQARESFHIRKRWQLKHLKNQIATVEQILARIDDKHNIAPIPTGGVISFDDLSVAGLI